MARIFQVPFIFKLYCSENNFCFCYVIEGTSLFFCQKISFENQCNSCYIAVTRQDLEISCDPKGMLERLLINTQENSRHFNITFFDVSYIK